MLCDADLRSKNPDIRNVVFDWTVGDLESYARLRGGESY